METRKTRGGTAMLEKLMSIQEEILKEQGIKTDVHITDGKGALFVPEGLPLKLKNVVHAVSESYLLFIHYAG